MAETSGKKKKGKAKSQGKKGTISLNEFLADGPTTSNTPPFRTKSWADESEELNDDELSTQWPESDRPKPQVNRSSLPSAPRASTVPNIDMTRLPKNPPYTVFLGNLSYEANEEDISKFFERHKLISRSVRLVKDKDGRMKGFGYAEFNNLTDLMEALSLSGLNLRNRNLQIDIAEGKDNEGRRGSRGDDSDRTAGDWRNTPRDAPSHLHGSRSDRYSPSYHDRGGSGYRSSRGGGYNEYRGRYTPPRRWSPSREYSRRDHSPRRDRRDHSPRRDRRDYSPRRDRRDYSPRRDRRDHSPRRDRRDYSPRRDSSPRRDRRDYSPRRDPSPKRDWRDYSPRRDPSPRHNVSPKRDVDYPSRQDHSPRRDKQKDSSPNRDSSPRRESRDHSPVATGTGDSPKQTSPSRREHSQSPDHHSPPGKDRSPPREEKNSQYTEDIDGNYRRDSDKESSDRIKDNERDKEYDRRDYDRDYERRDTGRRDYDRSRNYDRSQPYRDSDRRDRPYNERFGQGWSRGGRPQQYNGERRGGSDDDGYHNERRRGGRQYHGEGRRGDRDYRHDDYRGRGRSPPRRYDNRRSPEDVRFERPKLVLQPRTKPLEETASDSTTSSIFGGAKPVDTAKREREVEERLKAKEQLEVKEKEETNKKPAVTIFGGAKPVDTQRREQEIDERLRKAREDSEFIQEKNRKEDTTERSKQHSSSRDEQAVSSKPTNRESEHKVVSHDNKPRREDKGPISGRGRGNKRDDFRNSRDDRSVRGRGRGKSGGNRTERASAQPKKYEEPERQDFQQPNRFAALMDDDGDDNEIRDETPERQDPL